MILLPPDHTPGTTRRLSPRLANVHSGSITQKAITRKIELREGVGTGGLKGFHTYGRKKIAKKSKKCGVLLNDSDAHAFEDFLLGPI